MSWRAAAAVLITVFAIVLVQAVLAGPLITFQEDLSATGDYSNEHFDGNSIMEGLPSVWFHMGLIGMFGIMLWAIARVVRRELTRGQL